MGSHEEGFRSGMAFARRFAAGPAAEGWDELVRRVGAADAAELVGAIERIDPPERIALLGELEQQQTSRGAGFCGMLPDQMTEPVPAPLNDGTLLAAAARLAEIRSRNLKAIEQVMPRYALRFRGAPLPTPDRRLPAGWSLDLDLAACEATLDALDRGRLDEAESLRIARLPAFREMIRHRRELGYVPEPLIDEEGLAWCLRRAASRDPIDRIWIWLHPGNLFDVADLAVHRSEYRKLVGTLRESAQDIADLVLDPIERHAPVGATFHDRLTFAVGWGIAGWATASTAGINLEHFKDHHAELLRTLRHEAFHRFQLRICPRDPSADPDGFEGITRGGLEKAADEALHRGLAYVMLEGSATFIAAAPEPRWPEAVRPGIEILQRIASAEDPEAIDPLLDEGLRSNGPFYGLGALLAQRIVEADGPRALGESLCEGAAAFIRRAFGAPGEPIRVHRDLRNRIEKLADRLR